MLISIVFAILVIVVSIMLLSKVWVVCDAVLNNFDVSIKIKVRILMFFTIKYDSSIKKEKKKIEKKESKKKVTFKDIKEKKVDIFKMISLLCDIAKNSLKIDYFENNVTVALDDPMDTGLAYAAVMSAANIFYKTVDMKECYFDAEYDFESEEGLIIKHKSRVYIRPISVLKAYIKFLTAKRKI